jgi:hypothetical protein
MNKIYFLLTALFLSGCAARFNVNTENGHILSDSKGKMYYRNSYYNFISEVNTGADNYCLDTVIDSRAKIILNHTGFQWRKDSILYAGRSGFIVLKNKVDNLDKFRIINLYDSVLTKYPYDHWKENFYRQIIIDKKRKTYIINDLIPFKDKYLQRIEFSETNYNSFVDPTDLNSIVPYYHFYKETIPQRKETYHSILGKSPVKFLDPFEVFNYYFVKDSLLNYQSTSLAERQAKNYYSPQDRGIFNQMLATYYSFADNVQKADSVWQTLSHKNDTCNCQPAQNDLLKIISQNQVIMFNEAHHVPSHRLLLYNLLDSLYNQGFRYLALEAFVSDSLFDKTGFLSADNGYYLREPTFANLVRKAYKLGFQVFGYDVMEANRDSVQANNIYNNTLKKDSAAKVVVWAGWGHIDKNPNSMAGEFEKISGITPLTIDQTRGYNYCQKNQNLNNYYLFQPTNTMKGIKADLYVCNNLNLFDKKTCILTIADNYLREFCKMICIYEQNEFNFVRNNGKTPIPCSVVTTDGTDKVELNLQKGKYIVFFYDNYGNILKKFLFTAT